MSANEVVLFCTDGSVFRSVQMPPFKHPPDVVLTGVRTFTRQPDGNYIEAFAYCHPYGQEPQQKAHRRMAMAERRAGVLEAVSYLRETLEVMVADAENYPVQAAFAAIMDGELDKLEEHADEIGRDPPEEP